MPRTRVGEGQLGIEGMGGFAGVEPRTDVDLSRRMAASTIIKLTSEVLDLDPGSVTERDVKVMSPRVIVSGLFVPDGVDTGDIPNAYKGIVFPPDEFLIIARSPSDLARHTRVRTMSARSQTADIGAVEAASMRSAGHMLERKLAKLTSLREAILTEKSKISAFSGELHSANNTAFYGHYNAKNLMIIKAEVEGSIFRALHIAATTHGWDKEKLGRAESTLKFQLYGKESRRVRNWINYTDMVRDYTHKRGAITNIVMRDVKTELKKYRPFLDNEPKEQIS